MVVAESPSFDRLLARVRVVSELLDIAAESSPGIDEGIHAARRVMAPRLTVLVALAVATSGAGAQESVDQFLVGLTADNHDAVIPFASFDGTRWHARWGPPSDGDPATDKPPFAMISRIPEEWWGSLGVQTSWELVFVDGERREVTVIGTVLTGLGSGCARNLGLSGAFGPSPPYTLAVTAAGAVSAVEVVKEGSRDWKAISSLLPEFFHRARKPNSDGGVPHGAAPRPELQAAALASGPRGEFVYFESTRYWRLPPIAAGVRLPYAQFEFPTVVQGWLWRPDPLSRFQLVSTESFDADFSERKGSASFLPRGVVRAQGREYWLGVLSSYASSDPVIFYVSRGGVREVLRVGYGGC